MIRQKLPPYQRKRTPNRKMASNRVHIPDLLAGIVPLEYQVAGHTFEDGTGGIGLLKDQHDGSVLKPAAKAMCGVREIKFYEQFEEPKVGPIPKELIPEYRGTVKMPINGKMIEFIKLSDITHGMSEPCIIDIKIGKRTWDPLATPEKIKMEEQKYKACKQNLGFCIPGLQVYSVKSGTLRRYGKEYGKKLNEKTIINALKIFLNAETEMCRQLLMQFLSVLWSIQKWTRNQKSIRLYSSSLLLAYDARRLRYIQRKKCSSTSTNSLNGSLSSSTPPSPSDSNGNGDHTYKPGYQWTQSLTDPIEESYTKLQRSHSAQNNYELDMKTIRMDYSYLLDTLCGHYNDQNKEWGRLKMIDFAHVFPAEEESIDANYTFGIENLVRIFEDFLKECEQ